jgi:hypothetical protein
MESNHGYKIEKIMREWFKGKTHPLDCIDFQTKKCFYEVKSCRLFNECVNGNNKRDYIKKPHLKIRTTQLGRFAIKLENHKRLKATADRENKISKYIFVITIGKQKVWRVKSWEEVNEMISKEHKVSFIRIKDMFKEVWEDE